MNFGGGLPRTSRINPGTNAVLVTEGFEEPEMTEPRKALDEAGAETCLVSPIKDKVQAFRHHDKADVYPVDTPLDQAKAEAFDALVLPGGVVNGDALRGDPKAVDFVRGFVQAGKPISVICHGGSTLLEAGGVKDKRMTSWPSLKTDLSCADLPSFNRETIRVFAQAVRTGAAKK